LFADEGSDLEPIVSVVEGFNASEYVKGEGHWKEFGRCSATDQPIADRRVA